MKLQNIILACLFIAVFIFGLKCHGCSDGGDITRTDTVYVSVRDTATSVPDISFIEGGHIPEKVDTVKVIEKYYEKVGYVDSIYFPKIKGFVKIYDTLTQNRIIARQIFADWDMPIVTNTIYKGDRTQVFFGATGMGGPGVPMAVGPALIVKLKKGPAISASVMANTRGQLIYQGTFVVPIKFHK